MASQYLSDFSAPAINGNIARRVLANEVLRGVTQGILETNGEGVTQRFSNDVSGAQIRITQFMPFNQLARELGSTLNGENFDGRTALQASTNGLGVDVITVINQNIDIPQVTVDMLPIDFLGNCMKNLTMDINNNINAMTIGGKVVATFNNIAKGLADFEYITKATATGDEWRQALMNMNARLDAGDEANGIAFFPDDDRCYVLQVALIPYLLNKGVFSLGGANHAYEMLGLGGINPGKEQDIRSGYVGEFMGSPVYKATPLIWKMAAKYTGIPVYKLYEVYGYVSSGYANVRALAQQEQVKIIDSPDGDGVRIQPNFRMGFKALYPLGNVFLVETGYTNPATVDAPLTLKAPGSREAYSSDPSLASVTVGGKSAAYTAETKTWAVTGVSAGEQAVTMVATVAGKTYIQPLTVDAVSGTKTTYTINTIAEDGTVGRYTLTVN